MIIWDFLLFGLRPKSPSDPQSHYKKYDPEYFELIFAVLSQYLEDFRWKFGGFGRSLDRPKADAPPDFLQKIQKIQKYKKESHK